ncbi:hypothetical protein Hamer_G012621 [Homarus americanus]|uniref:Uncharacterized protein n=1 Tax=Homarus americanus TaxID=6706 RepID=A0A8J5MQY7_HOMAM|nr:hypothetical protein Hamer_G012621 [Homarus americanus]
MSISCPKRKEKNQGSTTESHKNISITIQGCAADRNPDSCSYCTDNQRCSGGRGPDFCSHYRLYSHVECQR